jgi:hypothetical protein
MTDNTQSRENAATWENKLFVIGFIEDAPQPYYEFAENLSTPAAYFRNDELWEEYKKAGALGNYWQIISHVIENVVEQRKIIISNVPMSMIEDKKHSHKITLAETRLIGMPAFKYIHYTKGNCEIFVPQELEDTHKAYLPKELQ